MKALLNVVILPVADPGRSLRFYRDEVGFYLDVDYAPAPGFRVIQSTPPGLGTSIQFGVGLTDATARLRARPVPTPGRSQPAES
jgi:hypothetical protein